MLYKKGGVGRRGRGGDKWFGDNAQRSVLQFDRPQRNGEHPTMKPVSLVALLMSNSCAPKGLVVDAFLGGGTTMVAAHETGRNCMGVEFSEHYCQVIVNRMMRLDEGLTLKKNGVEWDGQST
jgi:site-specific DNA-methyltransferase (adenine-specific)